MIMHCHKFSLPENKKIIITRIMLSSGVSKSCNLNCRAEIFSQSFAMILFNYSGQSNLIGYRCLKKKYTSHRFVSKRDSFVSSSRTFKFFVSQNSNQISEFLDLQNLIKFNKNIAKDTQKYVFPCKRQLSTMRSQAKTDSTKSSKFGQKCEKMITCFAPKF